MNAPEYPSAGMLTDYDVHTLLGYAHFLIGNGETDMPDYFLDLAGRIARAIGDNDLAAKVGELAERAKAGAT